MNYSSKQTSRNYLSPWGFMIIVLYLVTACGGPSKIRLSEIFLPGGQTISTDSPLQGRINTDSPEPFVTNGPVNRMDRDNNTAKVRAGTGIPSGLLDHLLLISVAQASPRYYHRVVCESDRRRMKKDASGRLDSNARYYCADRNALLTSAHIGLYPSGSSFCGHGQRTEMETGHMYVQAAGCTPPPSGQDWLITLTCCRAVPVNPSGY